MAEKSNSLRQQRKGECCLDIHSEKTHYYALTKQLMVAFLFLGQEAVPVLTAPLVLVLIPAPAPALDLALDLDLDLDLVDALSLGPRDVLVALPRFVPAPVPAPTRTPEAAPLLAVPLLHLPNQRSL